MSDLKPPRPMPIGNRAASDSNLPRLPREESIGDLSHDSRGALRAELKKRRMSLTPQEQGFLEELIIHGNEVELTVAHETLCDDVLFFDDIGDMDSSLGTSLTDDTSENRPPVTPDEMEKILQTSLRLRSSDNLGSAKRQEQLHQRKKSVVYGNMWKAHEHGFSIRGTKQRSKSIACLREEKTNAIRRSSFLSTETLNLISNGGPLVKEGEDGIFRRPEENKVFRKPPTVRGRSASVGARKVSWDRAGRASAQPKRPILRRLESEGSRKSVSFAEFDAEDGDHPTRLPGIPRRVLRKRDVSTDSAVSALETDLDDDASFPPLKHPEPVRSDSVSSIHSLHHAQPIRSDSVSSIPSLHHPHPVRSDSVASIHSIHHAHRIHSASSLPKDENDVFSITSIPSLHHGHPLREEPSLASIPSLRHGHLLHDEASLTSFGSTPEKDTPEKESREPRDPHKPQLLRHPAQEPQRPVLMRRASKNVYNGEGIEVEELPVEIEAVEFDSVSKARKYKSVLSFSETTTGSVLSTGSFDQAVNQDSIFRDLRRSLSDEGRSTFFLGSASPLSPRSSCKSVDTLRPEERDVDESWDMDQDSPDRHFDSWRVLTEDPSYGAGGDVPFHVLGTSAYDEASLPHVLSPPLMDSLRNFFPYSLTESNFWMKYSLLRDGASFHTLLQKVRGATHTIIAIETVDGEVFGSFTSGPWRKNWKYFGSGESFLWRMRQSRATPCFDVFDQAKLESELDVYPWSGTNDCIQLCTHDRLAVGGGVRVSDEKKNDDASTSTSTDYGFGLAIEKDLLYGTSMSCATFASPPLSNEHSDGSPFELVNLEVWALTPCSTLEEAEKLELGQLFLRTN